MRTQVVVRLGELAAPLAARLELTSEDASTYVRSLIAADLGIPTPEMRGQVANLKQFAKPKKRKPKRKT